MKVWNVHWKMKQKYAIEVALQFQDLIALKDVNEMLKDEISAMTPVNQLLMSWL